MAARVNRWRTAVAASGLVVAVSACSGGNVEAYCKVYDETHPKLASLSKAPTLPKAKTYSELEAQATVLQGQLNEMKAVMQQRRDAAPDELKESWDVLISNIDSGKTSSSSTLSEQKATKEATDKINTFAKDRCQLTGDM